MHCILRLIRTGAVVCLWLLGMTFPHLYAAEPVAPVAGFTVFQSGDNKLSLQVGDAQFQHVVTLKAPAGQVPLAAVSIKLGPLTREDGRMPGAAALTCEECQKPIEQIKPTAPVQLTLRGSQLERTKYLTTLQIEYGDKPRELIPIELNFTAEAAALEVGDLPTIPVSFPAVARLSFTACETAGLPARIYAPTFFPLARVENDSHQFGLGPEHFYLESLTINGHPQSDLKKEPDEIPARGCAAFVYRVSGLETTGHYQGQLMLSGSARAKTTKTFKFVVRDNPLLAWVVIAFGVFCSYLLFSWTRRERARDLRSARLAQARETWLRYFPLSAADAVRDELVERLDSLQRQNRDEDTLTDDALKTSLTDLNARLNYYRQAHSARTRVRELLDAYPNTTPEEQRKRAEFEQALRSHWRDLEAALLKPEGQGLGAEPADAPAQLKALHTLFDQIRQSLITLPANVLLADLQTLAQEAPTFALSAEELRKELAEIVTQANNNQFDGLTDRLEKARNGYATLRLKQLQRLLEQARRESAASPYAGQPALAGRITALLDAANLALAEAQAAATADKLSQWERARRAYLSALIERLSLSASAAGQPGGITNANDWALLLSDAPGLQGHLQQARQALEQNEFNAAAAAYELARDEYQHVQSAWLKRRISELETLVSKPPKFLSDADLQAAETESKQKELRDALKELPAALPAVADAPAEYRRKLIEARVKFVHWHGLGVRLGYDWLAAWYARVQKELDLPSPNPPWDEPATALRAALGEAHTAFTQYSNAPDKEAAFPTLLAAEAQGLAAQQLYQSLLELVPRMSGGKLMSAASVVAEAVTSQPFAALAEASAVGMLRSDALTLLPAPDLRNLSRIISPEQRPATYWRDRVKRGDLITLIIVLAVASFTGLIAVWDKNATFGSLMDYVTAFLWGFGFDAATKGFRDIAKTANLLPGDPQ